MAPRSALGLPFRGYANTLRRAYSDAVGFEWQKVRPVGKVYTFVDTDNERALLDRLRAEVH